MSFICAVFVMISALTGIAGAVSYSDLQPAYSLSSDKGYYKNKDYYTDDNLQLRANCYGYALRMFYTANELPLIIDNTNIKCYKQLPGEFCDRTASGQTYEQLGIFLSTVSSVSVFSKVLGDCPALGYNVTSLCVDPTSSYIPPAASSDTSKRLIVLVTGSTGGDGKDFHFYMQNSDGTSWSHKPGITEAKTTCSVHTSVTLTNSNICQHIHCGGYESTAIMFYIDAPGITDRGHLDGYQKSPYVTKPDYCEDAGGILKCAKALPSASYISKSGNINHRGDVDYFIFDVTSSGSHRIELLTSTKYTIYLQFAEVSNINYVSFNTVYSSSSNGRIAILPTFEVGKRYCVRIYSGDQAVHEKDRWYVLNIF